MLVFVFVAIKNLSIYLSIYSMMILLNMFDSNLLCDNFFSSGGSYELLEKNRRELYDVSLSWKNSYSKLNMYIDVIYISIYILYSIPC